MISLDLIINIGDNKTHLIVNISLEGDPYKMMAWNIDVS
jgi:hypothetical protein